MCQLLCQQVSLNVKAASSYSPFAFLFSTTRLQELPSHAPDLFVTLNPLHAPDPAKTLRKLTLSHPVFSFASVQAQVSRLPGGQRVEFHQCLSGTVQY